MQVDKSAFLLSLLTLCSEVSFNDGFIVFTPQQKQQHRPHQVMFASEESDEISGVRVPDSELSRREMLFSSVAMSAGLAMFNAEQVLAEEEQVESIAAKAARMAREVESNGKTEAQNVANTAETASRKLSAVDDRTIYDFSVPVSNKDVPMMEFINQEFPAPVPAPTPSETVSGEDVAEPAPPAVASRARVKAILVVNIKQDDPIARKNIPELITLASKFGKNGDFSVIAVPSDQGYYEPDTSALIRLKLDREYGYGINSATHLTDKMNLLGTGAHPMMRWLEGTCRTPSGLGRIQGNFEKFLIDGDTGKPLRRYPRKYSPYDIADDIKAVIDGKRLPPAGSNYLERWREAAIDAEHDTYRFQKGLNVFDQ